MALAFILINTDVAGEQEVMDALKKIPEVDSVHLVYGIYDLIVKVSSDSLDKLKTGVTGSLRNIPNKIHNDHDCCGIVNIKINL